MVQGWAFLLTHGAGGNRDAPVLLAAEKELTDAGAFVLRYDLPFRQKRRFGPPSPSGAAADRGGLAEQVTELRSRFKGPVWMGGHSYGGRQASMLAAEQKELTDGLLLLSYPLHPPDKPLQLRVAHFPALETPVLFVHGSKDPFGSVEELTAAAKAIPGRVEWMAVEGAGHDLKVKGGSGLTGLADRFAVLL